MLHNGWPLDLGVVLCSWCQKTSHGVILFPGRGGGFFALFGKGQWHSGGLARAVDVQDDP